MNINNSPKLGVVFPDREGEDLVVAFPLVLPMGWVNSPPAFCAVTDTSADIANAMIRSGEEPESHPLDKSASKQDETSIQCKPRDQRIPDIPRDPCLPRGEQTRSVQYIDVFMDDFLALVQGEHGCRQVRRILMKAIDEVFRLMDFYDELEQEI